MSEDELFQKIVDLKKERDLLYVLVEEIDEMMELNYTCSSCADETSGLLFAYREYKKWKNNANKA